MLKFYAQNKKGKKEIVLESEENKIILSNPTIQPYNEYIYNTPNDILYFYYDLSIYENINYFNSNKLTNSEKKKAQEIGKNVSPVWKKITTSLIYDFPMIQHLENFINEVINFDIKSKGVKTYFWEKDNENKLLISNTDYECCAAFKLAGPINEDVYQITKYCRYFESSYNDEVDDFCPKYIEWYEVFIGCGNTQVKNNVTGITLCLEENDLLKIKKWANTFIDYAGKITKTQIEKWYNKKEDSPYFPYFLRKHLQEKYPEDINKLKEIYPKLYTKTKILEEYYKYCKNNKIDNPIKIKKENKIFTAKTFMEQGMKDYEAYIALTEKY